jgi:hypothetical protein
MFARHALFLKGIGAWFDDHIQGAFPQAYRTGDRRNMTV